MSIQQWRWYRGGRALALGWTTLGCLLLLLAAGVAAGTDQELRQRIEEQGRNDKRLEDTQVLIWVQAGQVVLTGTVPLYSQKLRYEHIAWQSAGVTEVDNEIRVVPRQAVSDTVLERTVRHVIKDHQRFANAGITLSVKRGMVRIRGTFHDPHDVFFLKHVVADIAGVIRIDIKAGFAV